ncbi:hypothetical protein A5699_26010 [Mycobacterium sp. E802]|uniref:hypothetical protein n=1 Tax=Mycobacterium sp. E802 TaxID=1834152 RepID=UPI0007FC1DB1|nr:hypothetical protein [Mycobacterium sp. E802]OBG84786.1 hypothetical protein A5699_26010 [Mycobacterium sp. E802]
MTVLDFTREDPAIMIDCGSIEPLVPEVDQFVKIPLRVVCGQSGLGIELGPYTLTELDVYALRRVLAVHDDIWRQIG